MRRSRVLCTAVVGLATPSLLALQLIVAPGASANPGELDPTFGTGGIATHSVPDQVLVGASALAVQSDGKIVTAGALASSAGSQPSQWVIHRFLPNGDVDFGFGDGTGYVTYVPDILAATHYVTGLALQSNGDIVVGGYGDITAGISRVYVERFDSTGGTDDLFGGTGPVTFAPGDATLGGEVAVQEVTPGVERILVGAWVEGPDNPMYVTRLLDDGATDLGFGSEGVAAVPFGARSVIQDLLVAPDGKILVSGHVRNGAPLDHAGIGRLLPNGVVDTSFNGTGTNTYDLVAGADDHANSVAVRPNGNIVVGGTSYTSGGPVATMTELDAPGATVLGTLASAEMFGVGDESADGAAVVVDGDGIAYLTGSARLPDSTKRMAIRRFDGLLGDSAFGLQSFPCSDGGGLAVVLDAAQLPLISGRCGGFDQTVARYLTAPSIPALADVALTVTPSSAAAQALALPIGSLDRAVFSSPLNSSPLNSSPLNSSPLNSSPLNSSPLNSSPLNSSPLNSSPLNSSPLNSSSFPPTLLSEIPLRIPGGWEAILSDTALAGIPDNARTIQQVFALSPQPEEMATLTLAHIPLNSSPLNSSSLAATLYGNTPLVAVGLPLGSPEGTPPSERWCAYLAPMRFNCSNGVNPDVTPLWALELKGDDLSTFYGSDIPIFQGTPDPGSALMTIRLANIETSVTPLAFVSYASAPALFTCPVGGCADQDTLASAQAAPELPDIAPSAKVADLRPIPEMATLKLSELIVGLIPAADFPYESIGLNELFEQAGFEGDSAEYKLTFNLVCEQSNGLTLRFNLPNGSRYIPGSFTMDFGPASYNPPPSGDFSEVLLPPSPAPSPSGGPYFGDPSDGEGGLQYSQFGNPACTNDASNTAVPVTARLRALTPPELGLEEASASVRTDDVGPLRAPNATLATFDGPESNNDTFETAAPIGADVLYTGFISSKSDVDVWKFTAPPAGSQVTVYASHLPADFDFGIFGPRLADSRSAPLNSSPLNSSPLNSSPLNSSPLEDQGAYSAPGGANVAPDSLQDSPLNSSPLNSSPLNSSPLNSSTLRGSGVQRGLLDEEITLNITEEDAGQTFYLAGAGYNGATATSPYLVRMKTTRAAPDLPCVQRSFGSTGVNGADVSVGADRETLFLVNQKRFGDAYGLSQTDAMMAKLRSLAELPEVKGVVLPVESNSAVAAAYAAWDSDVCSITAANAVVDAVARLVDAKRAGVTGLRHLVLVGSDEMMPFFRVPDLVTLSNQHDYAEAAALGGLDNPISRAYRRGYVITDDKIGDFDPLPWFGSQLYVPDVGIGRVVESPTEIIGQADRVLGTATLPAMKSLDVTTSSFTAGYDFLRDGAQEIDQTLRSRASGGPASKISETWTAQDVTTALDANPRVSSVLAHYDHYRALPAANNLSANAPTPLFNATDLRSSALSPGALLFTLGCQSGLNIADTLVTLAPDHPDAKKEADWAQVATGEKLLTYAANTGFGYGDTEVVAYSERLFGNFARGLDGTATVGQAFALAKNAYVGGLGGLPKVGVYDHKLLSEATMYGWPFLRVGTSGLLAPSFVPQPAAPAPASPSMRTRSFDESMTFSRVDTTRGSYWKEAGQSLITEHFRPIEPMHTLDVTPTDGFKVNGVWFDLVKFRDIGTTGGIDPHLSVPAVDLASSAPEPVLGDIAFPAALSNFGTAPTANGRKTSLMLLTGQSASTAGLPPGRVVQRLFTRLAGEVARTDGNSFTPPQLRNMTAGVLGSAAVFRAETPDADVSRMRVFYTDDTTGPDSGGDITFKTVDLAAAGGGAWTGAVVLPSGATRVTQWWVQAQDRFGATSSSRNKVFYYTAEPQPATAATGLTLEVSPAPTASGFHTTNPTITVSPIAGDPPAAYEQSIDGSAFAPYTGPIAVAGDGYHRVEIRGSDGSSGTASMVIDTSSPVVSIRVPTEGQRFTAGQAVTAQFTCADAGSGIAKCEALDPVQLDTATTGPKTFRVRATDNVGQVTTLARKYTVDTRYIFEGFFAPVDNPNVYNKAKPGSSIPVKFRVRDGSTNAVMSSLSTVSSIVVTTIPCQANATIDPITEFDLLSTSGLKFDQTEQRFHYTWKTAVNWTGCKQLTITLDDGMKRFALFDFRK